VSQPSAYSSLQRILHWTVALIVAAMIPLGLYMVRQYVVTNFDAATVRLYDAHKLLGFIVLWLVVGRLLLRFLRRVPPLPATVNRAQRMAAAATHAGLYVLLIAVPVAGWMGASAYQLLSIPGGLSLPPIARHNEDFAGSILWWHGWGAIALGALAAVHIGAALFHGLVLRDGVLQRMWPSARVQ
jgi:cytochrome b561